MTRILAALALGAIEMLTLDFMFLMLAAGAGAPQEEPAQRAQQRQGDHEKRRWDREGGEVPPPLRTELRPQPRARQD